MAKKLEKPASIDDYLQSLPAVQRATLEQLRQAIRSTAPEAEECLSYGVPAFRQDGMLVGFGASAKHCSLFLMNGTTVDEHQELLAGYDTSKGTIRFPADKPLPKSLVRKLVKARLAENVARRPKRK